MCKIHVEASSDPLFRTRHESLVLICEQKVPNDVEAQRLLGEVQYEAGNYEASATAYRSSIRVNFLL